MNNNQQQPLLLDCTLRDGGYYNDWDFPTPMVGNYLRLMAECGIDFVEIGFRAPASAGFLGPYAYSTDQWLRALDVPEGMRLGVMCNAKDVIATDGSARIIHELFVEASQSPVELVRLAAHFREVEQCEAPVRALHALGYRVGLNLMQAGGRSEAEITEKAQLMATWPLEVLYFADSLGNMQPDEVQRTVGALRAGWSKDIGFHSHDNMGNALANSVAAMQAGARWIDATVLGMGRGAGNVRLEYLLLELEKREVRKTRMDGLLDFVVGEFGDLHRHYQWGPNIFYHLSGLYGVHPTYVQEMLAEDRYDHGQVISALQRLGRLGASGYSRKNLMAATGGDALRSPGSWQPGDMFKGRDLLLIGPGEGGRRHLEGLRQFIATAQPFVLCMNSNPWMPADLVDAWVACNPQRIALDRSFYETHSGRLVVPSGVLTDNASAALSNWELLDFGLTVEAGELRVTADAAILPQPLAALYAIALAEAGGAKRVLFAGLDGYDLRDPRHTEMEELLEQYCSRDTSLPLLSVTPSSLSVDSVSVYAPSV